MSRKPSPCGTKAAYERHLRKGEPVDDACRRANTVSQRQKRDAARRPEVALDGVEVPEPVGRLADLERQREVLWRAMQWAIQDDPARVAVLSKELREIWGELAELSDAEGAVDDPFDQFLNAPISLAERRERA